MYCKLKMSKRDEEERKRERCGWFEKFSPCAETVNVN